jgi:EAL domain-containing protein (putative c-di-GMP-specific phosphodiesterase class I)
MASDIGIMVDEIGIEIGLCGPFRLKTAYQPIFAVKGGSLVPVGVESRISPHLDARPVSQSGFLEGVHPSDMLAAESLCQALAMKNHRNIGVGGLELFFNYNPKTDFDLAAVLGEIGAVAEQFGEDGLDPSLLVCEITNAFAMDPDEIMLLADRLRLAGVRLALDDFGAGYTTEERFARIRPDCVKIEGSWFRRFCREISTARLLAPTVAGFRDRGARVLVEGIRTVTHLRVALEAGADLVQGDYLAEAALAGAIFNEAPLDIAALTADRRKVIPLFG